MWFKQITQSKCNTRSNLAADSISLLVCLLPGKHRRVTGCASQIMAVFYIHNMSWGLQVINLAVQLLLKVLNIVGALSSLPLGLSFSDSIPHLRTRTMSHLYVPQLHSFCMSVSLFFFFLSLFIFVCHPTYLCLSHPIHTPQSIGLYLFTLLLSHISITRQNGYGRLLRP